MNTFIYITVHHSSNINSWVIGPSLSVKDKDKLCGRLLAAVAPIPIRSAPDDINWVQLKEICFNSDKERLTQTREGQTMLRGSFQSTGKTRSLPVCIIFQDVDKLSIIVYYLKKKKKASYTSISSTVPHAKSGHTEEMNTSWFGNVSPVTRGIFILAR